MIDLANMSEVKLNGSGLDTVKVNGEKVWEILVDAELYITDALTEYGNDYSDGYYDQTMVGVTLNRSSDGYLHDDIFVKIKYSQQAKFISSNSSVVDSIATLTLSGSLNLGFFTNLGQQWNSDTTSTTHAHYYQPYNLTLMAIGYYDRDSGELVWYEGVSSNAKSFESTNNRYDFAWDNDTISMYGGGVVNDTPAATEGDDYVINLDFSIVNVASGYTDNPNRTQIKCVVSSDDISSPSSYLSMDSISLAVDYSGQKLYEYGVLQGTDSGTATMSLPSSANVSIGSSWDETINSAIEYQQSAPNISSSGIRLYGAGTTGAYISIGFGSGEFYSYNDNVYDSNNVYHAIKYVATVTDNR